MIERLVCIMRLSGKILWDLEYHRPCTSKVKERYMTISRAKSTSQTLTSLLTIEHSKKARTLPFNIAILFVFGFETRS